MLIINLSSTVNSAGIYEFFFKRLAIRITTIPAAAPNPGTFGLDFGSVDKTVAVGPGSGGVSGW